MKRLKCEGNLLNRLDLSQNIGIGGCTYLWCSEGPPPYVSLAHMPTLHEVCVWEMPFPPSDEYYIDTTGSPNVYFTTDCSDYKAPELSAADTLYQSEIIYVTSTENGMIYLVPEHTQNDLIIIQGASLDSADAVANLPVNISLWGLYNGVYWLLPGIQQGTYPSLRNSSYWVLESGKQELMKSNFIRIQRMIC